MQYINAWKGLQDCAEINHDNGKIVILSAEFLNLKS